jgi:hypothetical protein
VNRIRCALLGFPELLEVAVGLTVTGASAVGEGIGPMWFSKKSKYFARVHTRSAAYHPLAQIHPPIAGHQNTFVPLLQFNAAYRDLLTSCSELRGIFIEFFIHSQNDKITYILTPYQEGKENGPGRGA